MLIWEPFQHHPASQNSKAKPCNISGGANDNYTTYMYHVPPSKMHWKPAENRTKQKALILTPSSCICTGNSLNAK